ncbi:MAG: type II toxin-antitoxin system RelE/ParE family toxin [Treponema sp.]|jgi:phage-related protein|nr:type II toxin-antitoxin system RelE/ParE family toxin [Treponema sp.]
MGKGQRSCLNAATGKDHVVYAGDNKYQCLDKLYHFWYIVDMLDDQPAKVLEVRFFKTAAGNEPVRDWLKEKPREIKKAIGEDIKAVEFLWPVGYPRVTKLDKDLWEVRTDLKDGISRVFFTVWLGFMILLHGIVKKSQKPPKQDLDLAKKRRDIVQRGERDAK